MRWCFIISILFFIQRIETIEYRLPTTLSPTHYDIRIITHLDEVQNPFKFIGEARILIKCLEDTKVITLHSKDLKIFEQKTSVIDLRSNHKIFVSQQSQDNQNDFYTITLQKNLLANFEYELVLEYEGILRNGLAGYYRSSYQEMNSTKWLSVTQFESTDARRAFPCFDEPSYKAIFKITLGHHRKYTALSNMPLNRTVPMKDEEEWIWDEFVPSVPMSTYLVAFTIHDFKFKTSHRHKNSKVEFNIWSRKDALNQVNFARDIGPRVLEYFEKYFGIKYPLPKVDMIAIPDFSSGAMENWGLITYREVYLLNDASVSSLRNKHRVASVVSHELAHQWFGNLVTMKWWTDLWLNEGFATFMATEAVGHMFPEWNTVSEEVVENLLQVYALDSLKSSHPISIPIVNTNEIPQIFDTISYKKGSYLIRMMSLFLGDHVLRKGVSKYLEAHAYSNAEQDNLWDSLTKQAHEEMALPANLTVKTVMDTWTLQTGYPVITISRDCDSKTMQITQRRFFREGFETNSDDNCWWIPISYTTGLEADFSTTEPKFWLSCPKTTQVVPIDNCDSWLIANIQAAGLYKVNYDEANWEMIIGTLMGKDVGKIPAINRVLLIENSLDLAKTGHIPYDVPFELLSYLKNEEEYLPWKTALAKINYIGLMLRRSPQYGSFKKYLQNLITPIYHKLGVLDAETSSSEKSADTVYFRSLIIDFACKYNVSNCVSEALNLFQQWKNNDQEKNPIPSDFQSTVYCTAMSHGDEDDWNFLWSKYLKSNVGTEKNIMLGSLGCTKEIWLLYRYLQWSIEEGSGIRSQDTFTVFASVSNNEVGYLVAKMFFESRLKDIYKSLGPNAHRLSSYLSTLANHKISSHELKQLSKLTMENRRYFEKSKLGVEQAIETANTNVQWQKKYRNTVERLVKSKEKSV